MVFRRSLGYARVSWVLLVFVWSVSSAQDFGPPAGYYSPAADLAGDALHNSLHGIIDNHTVRSYDDFKLAGRTLDEDPDTPGNIILLYSGESFPGTLFGTSGEVWNREHVWPQSYGVDDSDPDFNTVGHSDFHHLFPALASVNSARSNNYFDWTDPNAVLTHPRAGTSTFDSNSWEPRDEDKGRVARAVLYMATRYEGLPAEKRVSSGVMPPDLKLSDRANSGSETMGKLSTLLEWNRMFQPDERERLRNHRIYDGFTFSTRTYKQGNRNPFVDHPEFADAIYTADQFVSYGSWRLAHFSPAELHDGEVSGDLADPDGDRIPNLVELAFNGNPRAEGEPSPLEVQVDGDTVTLRFVRLNQPEASALFTAVEASLDPWDEESWQIVPGSPVVTSLDSFTAEAVYTLQDVSPVPHYRLRISRGYPLADPGEAVFDPARFAAPAGSLFAYDPEPVPGWRISDWFAPAYEPGYAWVYQGTHRWIFLNGDSPDSVWMYDELLGWFWTARTLYPIAWSAGRGEWIAFHPGTTEPNRKLTLLKTGDQIFEGTF